MPSGYSDANLGGGVGALSRVAVSQVYVADKRVLLRVLDTRSRKGG